MLFHPAIVIIENCKKTNQNCILGQQITRAASYLGWHTNKKNSANWIYTINDSRSVLDNYILSIFNDLLTIWTKLKYFIYIYSKYLFPWQTDLTQSVLDCTRLLSTHKTPSFLFKRRLFSRVYLSSTKDHILLRT